MICFFSDPRLGYPAYSETFGGVPVPGEKEPDVRHAVDCVSSIKGKLLLIEGLRNAGVQHSVLPMRLKKRISLLIWCPSQGVFKIQQGIS